MSRVRLSLTARLSLMFVGVVVAVLLVAGLSFDHLSQHHFRMLDRQALVDKLAAARQLLGGADLASELPRLRALLGTQDLAARLVAHDGRVLFSLPQAEQVPERFWHAEADVMWEWSADRHLYRGMTAPLVVPGEAAPATLLLVLDVTSHRHFLDTVRQWFWRGLVLSAAVSGALGWVVVRRGLRPLRQVTEVAAAMSARSLKARIPLAPVPLELQQLVVSFNAMLARLDDAFVRLSDFSADIAHELRTPLSNLMTHTEVVLTRRRDPDAYEETLHSNLEDVRRMARMIDDMLFLAKADNGLIMPEQARVELAEVVARLCDYYRLLAEEQGIALVADGAGRVHGDRPMLERALSNLLSNALRYTPAGQTIRVAIRHTAEAVILTVENPGSIGAEHLDKLFDRFYRVDPARREGGPGNAGLGLAITRSIVEAHRGRIWCTSAGGRTAFHLAFPAPAGDAPEPGGAARDR